MKAFLRELKRRRVLNTAWLYVVGAWVALQVVEVLSGAGLPPSTMRNLLVVISVGFPVALLIGWFFDISKDGIKKTGPPGDSEELPDLKFIDHILLSGLLVVIALDVFILTIPFNTESPVTGDSNVQQRSIAVLAFDDEGLTEGGDPIGEVFADELRSSLTRVAGLRVLGPATSKALSAAGAERDAMAREMMVTAVLLGNVLIDGDQILVEARLIGLPAGNDVWSSSVTGAVSDAIKLQHGLLRQVIGAVAPNLSPDPVQGRRAEKGACAGVYDIYLRGKQLSRRRASEGDMRRRGVELLREAVAKDDQCALAWEAIAVEAVDWSMPGFARAGAAARRALELNDALPEAWSVLAEIAEQEERWKDSEEYFLRALYADPTNVHANQFYGEALLARGRVKEGLQFVMEAYRYDPASVSVNNHVALAAMRAGDGDLTIKHAGIFGDLMGEPEHPLVLMSLVEGFRLNQDTDSAVEAFTRMGFDSDHWFPRCIRISDEPGLADGVLESALETLGQFRAGELDFKRSVILGMALIRCGTWLREPDMGFDVLLAKGVPPFEDGVPTEVLFINFFFPDATVLRQDPRFHELVVESGLLDYWRKWGWADYCAADGDSFRCD